MKLILLILSFFISLVGYSQTISVSGTISTNTTWSADTVKVTGNININDLVTLTINPGTYVEFQGYYCIYVFGNMVSIGSLLDTIVFAINDTTGFSNTATTFGGWNSIDVISASAANDTTIFEYCKIMNTKGTGSGIDVINSKSRIEYCSFLNNRFALGLLGYYRPIVRFNSFRNGENAINIYKSNPLISYNYFTQNSWGILSHKSNAEIAYNTIYNSSICGIQTGSNGGGLIIHDNNVSYNARGMIVGFDTASSIYNNTINYNSYAFTGGGLTISNSDATIINNTIAYNTASGGSGIFVTNYSLPLIIFNKIANNYSSGTGCGVTDNGSGILCITSSAPTIMNNLICNNTTESNGGGIGCLDSVHVTVVNNTIVNNKSSSVFGGGGISLWNYSSAELTNNILWGNTGLASSSQEILVDTSSYPVSFNYCDIDDTINATAYYSPIVYQNLMMSNPKFVSPSAGAGISFNGLAANWSLQSSSPCINAGTPDTTGLNLYLTDIFGSPRIINDTVDIGAYENTSLVGIDDINNFINSDLLIFPNPTKENTNIILKNIVQGALSIKITNVLGQIVYSENTESASSFYSGSISISNFKNGIYSLIISDNSGKTYSSLIVKE